MTQNGLIGKSGEFYPCQFRGHVTTARLSLSDAPFVFCHSGEIAVFDGGTKPTPQQFETLMDWCIVHHQRFENVVDSQSDIWQDYL